MIRLLCLAVLLSVASMNATAQTSGVVRGGELPAPLPLFPPDNWWNQDISAAPVDPNSAAFIQFIGGALRRLHPDFGGDSGDVPPNALIFGIPYIVVPASQPLVPVVFQFNDESDPGAPGRPPGYPIPEQAKTETRWIEGGLPGRDGVDGDRHMLIVDRDNRLLYELFALRFNEPAGRWEAGSGAIFSLNSNARRPDGWTSADAAGLAILPGLVRWDEVFGTDPIRHAFRFTVRATNGYVFPASHRAGSTAGALPMGARLRLKSTKDLSSYTEPVRKIFQAMKTHGLIVADNGSDMFVSGTYDVRWDNGVLNPAFRSLNASDFEVVQLGWMPLRTLDVDRNGTMEPLTDGLLILRYLFGFRSTTLTTAAIGPGATRPTPAAIESHLAASVTLLDVDGNGSTRPLEDGLLILRYLFGFRGTTLTGGAVGNGATRSTPAAIEGYIAALQ